MNTNKSEYGKTQETFLEELTQPLLEFAKLDGGVIIRNDNDDKKFAHFHWNGLHFKFQHKLPTTTAELMNMLAFQREREKTSPASLRPLLKILASKPQRRMKKGCYNTVYDLAQDQWELLNDRSIDFID